MPLLIIFAAVSGFWGVLLLGNPQLFWTLRCRQIEKNPARKKYDLYFNGSTDPRPPNDYTSRSAVQWGCVYCDGGWIYFCGIFDRWAIGILQFTWHINVRLYLRQKLIIMR